MPVQEIQEVVGVGRQRAPRLIAQTVPVVGLDPAVRRQMWEIYFEHYTETQEKLFFGDLAKKSHVILLLDRADGTLQGFSTFDTYHTRVGGRRIAVFFSGDTVVRKAYWGQTVLQRAWIRNAIRFKLRNLGVPTYWFLITKGYKTYLLLSRNFPVYYPRHDRATPTFERALIDTLAGEKFGDAWKPAEGLLRFDSPMGKLRESVAPVGEELLRHEDIRYFLERNPAHASGEELCCIGKFNFHTVTSYLGKLGRRRLKKAWRGFF